MCVECVFVLFSEKEKMSHVVLCDESDYILICIVRVGEELTNWRFVVCFFFVEFSFPKLWRTKYVFYQNISRPFIGYLCVCNTPIC